MWIEPSNAFVWERIAPVKCAQRPSMTPTSNPIRSRLTVGYTRNWLERRGTHKARWLEPPGFVVKGAGGYFLVAQKISAMSSISARRRSATTTSFVFLASPAVLVAIQNRSWRFGYSFRWSGLK
jgi:hypothetical protein